MGGKADRQRRWLGAIFLGGAVMLLIAGETVLAGRLTPVGFFFFWMACLIFTCLAIVMALRDLSVTRQRMRDERRALFKSTLEDIARSAEARSKSPERDENNS